MGTSAWKRAGADHLGLPEPPGALAGDVRALGDRRWGTLDSAPALRGLGAFERRAAERLSPDEYVLAGVEDAATGMSAVHYLVCYGPVGLFVQVRAEPSGLPGGAVGPTVAGRERLALAGEVQNAAIEAALGGRFASGGRMLVLDSAFGPASWRVVADGADGISGGDGLVGALDWLGRIELR